MASSSSAHAVENKFVSFTPGGDPDQERHKLDRLRELRAVIDGLRYERESQDPLLAWIVNRERAEIRPGD
jgi:hypothetical protein